MIFTPRVYQEDAIEEGIKVIIGQSQKDEVLEVIESGEIPCPVIAMPTGTGKSIVIAELIARMTMRYPQCRSLMLTHVKELVQQNAEKFATQAPHIPMGINSAGLRRRDVGHAAIFAGIGSIAKQVSALGRRDIVIIDECHLVSAQENSVYQKVLAELRTLAPHMVVIGLSATPYRTKMGDITGNGIFNCTCFDATNIECFAWFVQNGFMAPLTPRHVREQVDISDVEIRGDFVLSQLAKKVNKEEINRRAVKNIIEEALATNRQSWLVFSAGVDHAIAITEIFQEYGIAATCVHSKMGVKERNLRIAAHKRGEVQCMVNNGILTTGYDHPPIDLIAVLRHTMSVSLWVQMLGRGTRPCSEAGKTDCLVLDFCDNTSRLGPINDPYKPQAVKKNKEPGECPMKICPKCDCYNFTAAPLCAYCGHEFPRHSKIKNAASTKELMVGVKLETETYQVMHVLYTLHTKVGMPQSVKVTYQCVCNGTAKSFSEWVCIEHTGHARNKALSWWRQRTTIPFPDTTHQALSHVTHINRPKSIRVVVNRKYPEIEGYQF